jgi:transforming growth factor-beta-induced protein
MSYNPFSFLFLILLLIGCAIEAPDDPFIIEPGPIPAVVAETPDLKYFEEAMTLSELEEELASDGPFTLLAPSNAAFEEFLEDHQEWQVLEDIPRDALRELLRYHLLIGKATSNSLTLADELTSVLDKIVYVTDIGTQISFNKQASVETADIDAENGVIHVIDAVLVPMSNSPFEED